MTDAPPKKDVKEAIVDAALAAIEAEGWQGLSLGAVAARAGLTLADLYDHFPSKPALLKAFLARIDRAALAEEVEAGPEAGPRERLFDALMLRFEAMEPYRGALRVLRLELQRDPATLLALGPAARRSCAFALEAAHLDSSGFAGAGRTRLVGYIALRTFDVWLDDDPQGLPKTMADLDRRLRRSERWLGGVRHSGPAPTARAAE